MTATNVPNNGNRGVCPRESKFMPIEERRAKLWVGLDHHCRTLKRAIWFECGELIDNRRPTVTMLALKG